VKLVCMQSREQFGAHTSFDRVELLSSRAKVEALVGVS
jgi:hypothetical protein